MRSTGGLGHLLTEGGTWKVANLVTLSRALLIAPILLLLLAGWRWGALGLYAVAASTDLVDGWLARRAGRASAFGAQLDAVVDNLFSIAILALLLIDLPGLLDRHGAALAILFAGPLVYLAVSWLLSRRVLMFHFWSAKGGAVLLFCLWPLVALSRWEGLIPIVAAVVGFSRIEQIVFILRGGRVLDAPHAFAPVRSERRAPLA